ncbi:hypothetical protein [Pseudomonas vanderleydeniana]|uniref:Uncharacterized protein n=1 Tax=Pseudomonas vanderleydeniana TaxID=2745495 RepID=A0A9E6PQT9_9PSED|nr:hypothetical protein [Pseudomonas vanderleydeniana]QXI30767.1 hypothetical protein HU752_012820 [Pseudomonas vanderleydeniana]
MMRTADAVRLLILAALFGGAVVLAPAQPRQDGFAHVTPGHAAWAPKDYWPGP